MIVDTVINMPTIQTALLKKVKLVTKKLTTVSFLSVISFTIAYKTNLLFLTIMSPPPFKVFILATIVLSILGSPSVIILR